MPKALTKAELQEALDAVVDVLDDALDPRLTREEVVSKIADLRDQIAPVDYDDEEGGLEHDLDEGEE